MATAGNGRIFLRFPRTFEMSIGCVRGNRRQPSSNCEDFRQLTIGILRGNRRQSSGFYLGFTIDFNLDVNQEFPGVFNLDFAALFRQFLSAGNLFTADRRRVVSSSRLHATDQERRDAR